MDWLVDHRRITLPSLRRNANSLLSSGLLALLLVAYIVLAYVLIIAVAILLLGSTQGRYSAIPWWLTGVAFTGIAITLWPVGRWLRYRINDLVYAQYDDPYTLLSQLNQNLEGISAPDALLPTVAATLAATLNLPFVAIETALTAERSAATYGTPPRHAEIVSIPLSYRATTLGTLHVSARRPHEHLSADDRRLLADLARQVGITLHAAQLTQALQASREQLVLAREEERRRIRRDLHDELGPMLAALAMQADTAQVLIESDPATARQLMATVTLEAKEMVVEVRRLVYDLRLPALDELGLVGALERLARQHGSVGLLIEVSAPASLPVLSAAVEVAIYRIVAEALTNVVRHANATRCTIQLDVDSGLTLTVEDNGRGMGEQIVAGLGLQSMRERASEVNGVLIVGHGSNSGTKIVAQFPLRADKEER